MCSVPNKPNYNESFIVAAFATYELFFANDMLAMAERKKYEYERIFAYAVLIWYTFHSE